MMNYLNLGISKKAFDYIKRNDLTIVIEDPSPHGWTIVVDGKGTLWSIANSGNEKGNSLYGDRDHLKRLLSHRVCKKGIIEGVTDAGLEYLKGLHSRLFEDSKGNKFSVLSF